MGMDFELTEDLILKIMMKQYLEECIDSSDKDIKTTISFANGHGLFKLNESLLRLSKDKSEIFHHIVSKLQFVYKRSRLDLRTGVTKITEEYQLKLKVLCFT